LYDLENRNNKTVIIIMLIALLSALSILSGNLVLAQNTSGDLSLSVTTDMSEYVTGENVVVSGYVYNTTTHEPVNVVVQVQILKGSDVTFTVNEATFNGKYSNGDYKVPNSGKLTITAKTTLNGVTATGSTTVNAKSYPWYYSILGTGIPIIVAGFSLVYFLILLFPTEKFKLEDHKFVTAEFAFLTIFTVGVTLSFFFTTAPFGENTPMGLVINTYGNETQWVINVGGQSLAGLQQYAGGIQVPVYVIILAFLGAYAYFLTKVPSFLNEKDQGKLEHEGLEYLVRFFVAPLLAAALYLVLWQLDVRGTFILGATSFATGMIIEQVVERIMLFAKNTIGTGETKPGETKPGETKPGETKPGETKPGETKPGETKPGETKS
jgi:uncharacterized low-complexity protein